MTTRPVLVAFLLVASLSGCGPAALTVPEGFVEIQLVSPDGRTVSVAAELATTTAEQRRGLMDRTALADGFGMLFIFEKSAVLSFWMKNTLIPLDIIFFDGEGNLVSQASMFPCPAESAVCPSTRSEGPARFALEVPAGFVRKTGSTRGWKLVLGPWAQHS